MSSADQLSRPLRLEADPFTAGAAVPYVGRPLQTAFQEIIGQIGRQSPLILVTGSPGTGKTLLADMTARACAEKNLSVQRAHRGDLMHRALCQRSDVLLVDEANSVAESVLQALSLGEGKNPATTIVFLGLPSCVSRFLLSKIHPVIIELTLLPPADARIYLLEQANQAGLPDLFTTEALDLIINGSLGSPRLLRSNASLAYFGAASDGAFQISRKYVASALVGQVPLAAQNVHESTLVVRCSDKSAAELQRAVEVPAEIQKLAESIDEFAGTPTEQTVEIASDTQEMSDSAGQLASDARTQVEDRQAIGIATKTEATKSDDGFVWAGSAPVEEQRAVDIPTHSRKPTESVDGLIREMGTPVDDERSAGTASDAPPLAQSLFRRRADETPTESRSDARQFRTALSSFSARKWLKNLKYLGGSSMISRRALVVATVFIGIAAVTLGTVLPSLLTGASPSFATRLKNVPAPVQASGFVGRTPTLPSIASDELEKIVKAAPVLSHAENPAVSEKEPAGPVTEAKKFVAGAAEVKKATGRPLTAEEEAAVARGIRELGPQAAGRHMLVVVHAVNVHASPSPGKAVSTLRRGLKVAMIEQRGQWTLVEIEGDGHSTKPKQGWVFNTFLKDEDGEIASSEESK